MLHNKFISFIWLASLFLLTSAAVTAEVSVLTYAPTQHTRTLATSCAACHGTQGNSIGISPVLAGLNATYFTAQMLAFKNGGRTSTVMHHHAKGLNTDEINELAIYFSQQTRVTNSALKPQTLIVSHE